MALPDPFTNRTYLGYDKRGLPFVLRYSAKAEAWLAIGFEPHPYPNKEYGDDFQPLVVRCADDKADFIVNWKEMPNGA